MESTLVKRKYYRESSANSLLRGYCYISTKGLRNIFTNHETKPTSILIKMAIIHDLGKSSENRVKFAFFYPYPCVLDIDLNMGVIPFDSFNKDITLISILNSIRK